MKNKIKFYYIRNFFNGMLVALGIVNLINAIEEKFGWFDIIVCVAWLSLMICFTILDNLAINRLIDKEPKVDEENTSVLGAQLYGKAKLEKRKKDDDLDIKMLHDLENKKR